MTYRSYPNETVVKLKQCAEQGMTAPEAARAIGITRKHAYRVGRSRKINFAPSVCKHQKASIADIQRCANAGMVKVEAARELGINESTLGLRARKYGISFTDGRGKKKRLEEESKSTDQPTYPTAPIFFLHHEPSDDLLRQIKPSLDSYAEAESAAMRKRGQGMTAV